MSDSAADTNCDFEFTDDNLTALWLEFQQQQSEHADCPVTGAAINLTLENDPAQGQGEPVVQVKCSKCGRETEFEPGEHEGFGWAE